mgnify:CR=1 FL=1
MTAVCPDCAALRAQLDEAMGALAAGDLLIVVRVDGEAPRPRKTEGAEEPRDPQRLPRGLRCLEVDG